MTAETESTMSELMNEFKEKETRFFEAIKSDDEETLTELLSDPDFYAYLIQDKLSLAFIQVILLNNVKLLKLLVAYGIDIQEMDPMFHENGLMHAVRYGHVEMMSCLLAEGIKVNQQSKNGSTALHVAVENKKLDCLKILGDQRGIDLNIQDSSGYSPLMWSARLRDCRAMQFLIDAGCNIDSTHCRTQGLNALHICVDNERAFWKGKTATSSDMTKCIDILVQAGLDINKGDNCGNPPLIYALQSNNMVAVKHLLRLNCDTECRSPAGRGLFYFEPITYDLPLVGMDSTLLALYTAIFKLNLHALKILCASGVKYHKLKNEHQVIHYASRSKTMEQFLQAILSQPFTLKQSCQKTIRSILGLDVESKVMTLGLPMVLRDYLTLKDLDKVI